MYGTFARGSGRDRGLSEPDSDAEDIQRQVNAFILSRPSVILAQWCKLTKPTMILMIRIKRFEKG